MTCTVTATDKGDHSVTTQLSITVNEINDNPPVLDKGSYSYFVSQCSSVGSQVGQVTATDKDIKTEHKDVTFALSSNAGFLVGNDGSIRVIQDLCDVPVGTKYDLTLTVSNADGTKDTAPVTIVITGKHGKGPEISSDRIEYVKLSLPILYLLSLFNCQ